MKLNAICNSILVGMLGLASARVMAIDALQSGSTAAGVSTVTAENPLAMARSAETLEIPWKGENATVFDAGTPIPSQIVEGKLLFQYDFGPGQSKTFTVTSAPSPIFPVRAYGRHVPERMDDYAWENDRIAFRIYGPALMAKPPRGEGLISSGIDVWLKRTRNPVIEKWYKSKSYHNDTGEGLDCYKVGSGRGCGGVAVLVDGKFYISQNWKLQKTLAVGPIRTAAEITYASWDCGNGVSVAETRKIMLDAGSNLNRFESRFEITGTNSVTLAVGMDVSSAHQHKGKLVGGIAKGFLANWEAEQKSNGSTATAILVPMATGEGKDNVNAFLIAPVQSGVPFVWYAGAGWSKSGDFADAAAWTAAVEQFSARQKVPIKIKCR
jgi:unsaturated rhamnogalacturonyl hydrolase